LRSRPVERYGMKTAFALRAAAAAAFLVLLPGVAAAWPGQTITQFTRWAEGNSAFIGLTKKMGEMSGAPYYTATFVAGNVHGNFMANANSDSQIVDESVAVAGAGDTYDILKHPETSLLLLTTVYGTTAASDFRSATKVGSWTLHGQSQPTALYRGSAFGYELAYAFVKLIPLSMVAQEAKTLASCVDTECGD
jgi:hypothetical protein